VIRMLAALLPIALAAGAVNLRAAEAMPSGKLPTDATPQHYTLHLTIDPRRERFDGEATIRVKLAQKTDHVWLHAQQIAIKHTGLTGADGKAIEATSIAHGDSGVLEVRFAHALPAQEIQLSFAYDAPFNRCVSPIPRRARARNCRRGSSRCARRRARAWTAFLRAPRNGWRR